MRWHALLLGLLVLASGCLGFGGDEAEETDEDIDAQDANETDTDEEAPEETNRTEWSSETYEGTIAGTPFFAPSPPSEQQSFAFTVANGTQTLFINVTTEGGDLTMYVADPDCQPGPDATCEEAVETEDGEAQFSAEGPMEGEWNVRFFSSQTVATGISYTAEVAQGLLVEA